MAAITTIKPRGIDTTGDYVVNSLSSTGNVSAGNIKTDNLLYANGSPYAFTTNAAGTNTQIQFNDGNSFAGDANLTFNKTTGTLTVALISGNGSSLTNVNAVTLNGHSDTYFASTSYVDDAIGNLVDGAPALLDTLNELANALGNDASFTTSITNSLANKANTADLSTVATSGDYTDLINTPSLFDGEYASLANKPSLFSGEYVDLANKPSLFSGSYLDLTNTPTLFDGEYSSLANAPALFSGSYLDLTNTPTLFDGEYSSLANTPTLGTAASTDANAYATAAQGTLADSATQPGDNVSSLLNDAGYLVAGNLTGYATETFVGTEIANLVASAPAALDTLNELANALGNDASFSTSITNSLANKLSTSDFTSSANTAIDNRVTKSFVDALAVTANIANVAYSVDGANVSGQVANALIAGTVYTNAQPNITSLGVLTSLEVSGHITPTANIVYDLGNNTNRFRDLYLSGDTLELGGGTITISGNSMVLTNPAGGSFVVDGSNAAYASIASYVTEGIQANITQLGTLSNLAVTGNVTAGNILTDNILYANGSPYAFSSDLANLTDVDVAGVADGEILSYDAATSKWVNIVAPTGGAAGGESTVTSVDTFTGDGVETVFTLSVTPANINQTFINYNGALQLRNAYTLSGADITFSEAPADGSAIEVTTTMGVTSGSGNLTVRNYVADGVQLTYAVSSGVNATNILVTENGLVQTPTTDYTVAGGTLTFITAPGYGVKIQIRELGTAVSTITPVGSNTRVLFNDAGDFGHSAGFTFNKSTSTLSANNIISGNILPSANITYDLGSPTMSWKDLYLSGNTIHLGGAQISVDSTSGAVSLTPAATVSNPTPAPQVISSPRYITMVKTGNITTPDTGTSRYYPPKDVTISNVLASLSTASTSNLQFTINKNGSNTGAYTISSNAYQLTKTVANISLTTSDYLTVNILSGEGAAELRLDLEYTDA